MTEVIVFPLIKPVKNDDSGAIASQDRGATHSILAELTILPRTATGTLALCKLERTTTDRGIMRNAVFRSYQLWLDYFASSLVCRQLTRQ